MKTFKYGNFEIEIDNTDVLFLEKFEAADEYYNKTAEKLDTTGTASNMMRQTCELFKNTFSMMLGEDAYEKMFEGRCSAEEHIKAYKQLIDTISDYSGTTTLLSEITAGNRAQRRLKARSKK